MPSTRRRPDVPWLMLVPTVQALLDQGGRRVPHGQHRGNHPIVARVDEVGPDPRFRLSSWHQAFLWSGSLAASLPSKATGKSSLELAETSQSATSRGPVTQLLQHLQYVFH